MNLVQVSSIFRKIVNVILTIATFYIIAKVSYPILVNGYNKLSPPKDLPTVKYGKLPRLEFFEKELVGEIQSIKLNTASGRLPGGIPNKLPVYKFESVLFSYEAGRRAQTNAEKLGFTDEELITDLKGDTFRWRDRETGGVLNIQINTKELTLDAPLANRSSLFSTGRLTEASARKQAKGTLNGIGRLFDLQYAREEGVVTFGKFKNEVLEKANTPQEAQIARVDYFRNVGPYRIVGPDPKKGVISLLVKSPDSGPIVLNNPYIDYHEWAIINDPTATYPIISVQEAWDAVANQKKGVVVSVTPVESSIFTPYSPVRVDTVLINEISIGYYDTPKRQDFAQPIYVFEGSYNTSGRPGGSITLYFPAIQGQYVENAAPVSQTDTPTQ